MAQRMESVAPPGGVMLSESTARLVEAAALGEPEMVRIKGADDRWPRAAWLRHAAQRASAAGHRNWSVGEWETEHRRRHAGRAISGHGCVVGVTGRPASARAVWSVRTARRAAAGSEVFSDLLRVPRQPISRFMRWRGCCALPPDRRSRDPDARGSVRAQVPDGGDPEDMVLLDDLLGIADPDAALPNIDPDARRRRLTALINPLSLARTTRRSTSIEDVHWIDEASESMLADFLTVIPQTPSLVLITYRPEYRER